MNVVGTSGGERVLLPKRVTPPGAVRVGGQGSRGEVTLLVSNLPDGVRHRLGPVRPHRLLLLHRPRQALHVRPRVLFPHRYSITEALSLFLRSTCSLAAEFDGLHQTRILGYWVLLPLHVRKNLHIEFVRPVLFSYCEHW